MDKDQQIQITGRLYKATLLFPKKEPLRYKLREIAVNILAVPTEGDFETMDKFLEVAKFQNWVPASEILEIQSNYANLRRTLKSSFVSPQVAVFAEKKVGADHLVVRKSGRNERQEKIIDFLKENTRAQVWELKQVFPRVSKRTLRRDFEFLLKQGAVQRIGERNNTFYQIKSI